MAQYKVDLHNHSTLSHDGGISEQQYLQLIEEGKLDYIAITDHNEVDFAIEMNEKHGNHFIVGEEIKAQGGEIIALFITKKIEPKQPLLETIKQVKAQGGIIYIAHPFDVRRSGLSKKQIIEILDHIDIFEVFNPRNILPKGNANAFKFAQEHALPMAAGSDAHSFAEIGNTYTIINGIPNRDNIKELFSNSMIMKKNVKFWHLLNPKLNKLKKKLGR